MQPYRSVKPHLGTDCPDCQPTRAGHRLCQNDGCDGDATTQIQRHATADEYAALPENLMPIDGVCMIRVDACDDCGETAAQPFCSHPEPDPAPCPKCHAVGEQPCTGRNGGPRQAWHRARHDAQPQAEACQHAHRPDCGIFDGCQCDTGDAAPERPKRPRGAGNGPDISGLTMPVHIAQMLLAATQHPWSTIVRAWNQLSQDNRPQLAAEVYTLDGNGHRMLDEHGHWVTATIAIDLQQGCNFP
jgi:hypothetical protein